MLKCYLLYTVISSFVILKSNAQVYRHPIKKAGQIDLALKTGIHLPFSHMKSKIHRDVRVTGLAGFSIRYFYTEFLSIQTGFEWIRKGGFYLEEIRGQFNE